MGRGSTPKLARWLLPTRACSDDFYWAPAWRSKSDCGQIAACYIANLYGRKLSISDVKKNLPVTETGVSCAQLENYLIDQGIPYHTVWVNPKSFKELPVPAIIHADYKNDRRHFYVLLDVNRDNDRFTILNTSFGGIKEVDGREIRSSATGYVLVPKSKHATVWALIAASMIAGFLLSIWLVPKGRKAVGSTPE